jgi:hypothetical protein
MRVTGVLLVVVAAGLVAGLAFPRWRRRFMRGLGIVVGGIIAIYLVARGVAELFIVDFSQPQTYRNDWGGPSLAGVLAVHTGPAVVIVAAALAYFIRRCRRGRSSDHGGPPSHDHVRTNRQHPETP